MVSAWRILLLLFLFSLPVLAQESVEQEIKDLKARGAREVLRGKSDLGLSLLQQAVEKGRAHYGEDSLETAELYRALGISASMVQRFEVAQPAFESALAGQEKSGQPTGLAEAQADLAWLYRRLGRTQEALDLYRSALKLRQSHLGQKNEKTLTLFREIALTHRERDEIAEGLRVCEQGLPLFEDGYQKSNLLLLASELAALEKDKERALGYLDTALESSIKTLTKRHGQVGEIYLNRAQICLDAKDFTRARAELSLALELVANSYDRGLEGKIWTGFALIDYAQKKLPEAAESFGKSAQAYAGKTGYTQDQAISLFRVAQVERERERLDEAEDFFKQALAIGRGGLNVDALEELADIAKLKGDNSRALGHLKEALKLAQENWGLEHPRTGDLLVQVAIAEFEAGFYGEAVDRLETALGSLQKAPKLKKGASSILAILYAIGGETDSARKLLKVLGDEQSPLFCRARGMVRFSLGDYELAVKELEAAGQVNPFLLTTSYYKLGEYERGWELLQKHKDPSDNRWLRLKAQFLEQRGDLDGALETFRMAARQLEDFCQDRLRADLRSGHGVVAFKMYERTGDRALLEEACQAFEGAAADFERLRFQSNDERTGRAISKSFSDFYAYAVEAEIARSQPERALRFADQSLSREMLRASVRARVFEELKVSATEREELAELDREQQALELQFSGLSPMQSSMKDVSDRLQALEHKRRTLLDELSKKVPAYALLGQRDPFQLKELQEQLKEDELVLLYFLAPVHSFGFLIDKQGVETFRLPSDEELSKRVRKLSVAVRRKSLRASVLGSQPKLANKDRRALGEDLLGPVAEKIAGKDLIVVPTGVLLKVPFELLPVPGGENFLALSNNVSYLPSLSLLRAPSETRASSKALLVGDAKYRRFSPLPFTGEEIEKTAQLLAQGGITCDIARAGDATLGTLEKKSWEDYRYLHFATHGTLAGQPSLILSEDARLEMSRVMGLPLRAELAVLSACETGLGELAPGEGVLGMSRAFLFAGTDSVVVSLWSVDDASTNKLMAKFYQGLIEEGKSPRLALNEARKHLIKENHKPHQWAPFILISQGAR